MGIPVHIALEEMARGRKQRYWSLGGIPLGARERDLQVLDERMFSPPENGDAFRVLTPEELAVLEWKITRYREGRQLIVTEENDELGELYRFIRANHITGATIAQPVDFRSASREITGYLMRLAAQWYVSNPERAVVLLPWRAGLAFADAAVAAGIRYFYHLGVMRDHQTLQPKVYYEERPENWEDADTVIVADPMLATGGTALDAVYRCISEERLRTIMCVAVITAPEGVHRVIEACHDYVAAVITGRHDERLNERGYIMPGLGDYGDQYFAGLTRDDAARWHEKGVLSARALAALCERMDELAAEEAAS